QTWERQWGAARPRSAAGMLPLCERRDGGAGEIGGGVTSPVFNYPYGRARAALDAMQRREGWDPHAGLRLRYTNPLDGGWAMPTIGTFLQLLPRGFATRSY